MGKQNLIPEPIIEPKEKVSPEGFDFMAAYMGGVKPTDIWKSVEYGQQMTGKKIDVLPPDFNNFQLLRPDLQGEDAENTFKEIQDVYRQYKNVEFNAFDSDIPSLPNTEILRKLTGNAGLMPSTEKFNTGKVTGYMNTYSGTPVQINTDQEIASFNTSIFKGKDGYWKPIDEMKNSTGYFELQTGNDKEPNYYWKEKEEYEYINPEKMLSVWGPTKVNSNLFGSIGRGLTGGVFMMFSGIGQLVDVVGDLIKPIFYDKEYINDPKNSEMWITDRVGNHMTNFGNRATRMNEDEKRGMFDNWNGAFYSVFNGVGQMAPIILSSGIAYGGTKAIGTAGARLLGKEALTGLEAGLTASKISNVAAKVSYQTGLLMGSVESMGAYRQQMKNMGIDDFTSAKWSVPFAMATYVSEIALGKNIVASWYGRNLGGGIRKEVVSATKSLELKVLKETGQKLKDLPKETQNKYMSSFWKGLMDKRSKFNAWSTSSKLKETFSGAVQEALEENPIEATMDYGLESWYNSAVVGQSQNIIKNIGGNTYTKEPAIYEGINPQTGEHVRVQKGEVYYRNTPSGQKQLIDKALWEAEQLDIANAKKVIDKGEMMFDDPGGNFSLDQPLSAFISTLLTLGLGSAVTSTGLFNSEKAKKTKEQSDNLSNLAYKIVTNPKKYSRAAVENELNNLQKETKVYGRDFVTIDNDVLVPNDTRPSEAQARIKLIMDELDLKVNAIQTHGLGSPSATTAMAGDNELINKATTIATKITTLEQQKANVEKGTEQGDIVKIEEEIEGLKMELNDYIVPKDGPNGKEKSIAYTRKNVKIEYFKYFLEDEAKKSTEKQLEDKKDKLSSSEYQKEYDKIFDLTYKTYIRNADTILLRFKSNYDSFYNTYVKDFEQQSRGLTKVIDNQIAEQVKKYSDQDVESIVNEKLQNVRTIISQIPNISSGDISNVTPEVKDHFDNVQGIIGEIHQMMKSDKINASVLSDINSLTDNFKNLVNDYATTKVNNKEDGGLSDKLTDLQASGTEYKTAMPESDLVALGLHIGDIQKDINTPESDKLLFKALLGNIEDNPIVLYDANGKVALETTIGKIINTYSGYVGSKIKIPNAAEALSQVTKVEQYLEEVKNYIDINRNFFQKVIESNPEKTEHSFLHIYPKTRISEQNENALNEVIKGYEKSIDDIKKELDKSVYVRDLEQTQKKIQLLDLRYSNLVFYRDTIKTELTQEQGAWLVEIDKTMEIFKGETNNKFNALFDLYKKETSTGGVVNEKADRLREVITYIESLIVNIENSFSGKLDKTLDWIKENFNNPEYLFNNKNDTYISFDEFYLQMPYTDGSYGGLISQMGFDYNDVGALGHYFRAYWLSTWTARLNSMGQGNNPSMKEIYAAYLETEQERVNSMKNISNFEQEFGMVHLVSHYFEPYIEFLDDLSKGKNEVNGKIKPTINYDKFIPGSLRFAGFAGAGKTTQALATAIPTIFKLNKGQIIKVAIINPTESNEVNHKNNAKENFADKTEITYYQLKDIVDGSKQIDSNIDLIIIDEGSLITELMLKGGEINNKKLKGLKQNLPKDKRIWILADDTQPASVDENGRPYNFQTLPISHTGERTLPVTAIHRNSIAIFHSIVNHFRTYKFNKDIGKLLDLPYASYTNVDGVNVGARYRKDTDEVIKSFIADIKAHQGSTVKDIMLIVDSELTKKRILDSNPELKGYAENIKTLSYMMYDSGAFAGGLDSKNVYFAVSLNDYNKNGSIGEAMTISRYGVVGAGRVKLYLEMVGPVDKSKEGTVIGSEEALGKIPVIDFNDARNEERLKNIERLKLIVGDTKVKSVETFDRSTVLFDDSNIKITKPYLDKFTKKEVDENDPNSVSNIIFNQLPEEQKKDVNIDSKQRNKILRLVFEYEFADEKQKLIIDDKIKKELKEYLQKDSDDDVLAFQSSILHSMDKNMFRDILGNEKNAFLFKNISFNKINGNPFLVKVVGINQKVPIVDIYDISFKKDADGLSNVTDYNKNKLGLYAAIMMANGFKINNLHLLNLQNQIMGKHAGFVLLSNVVTLDNEQFEAGVTNGNRILGQVTNNRVSLEDFYINDRIIDHPSIQVGDAYINKKGETVSVQEITTLYDSKSKSFVNHVWLNGIKDPIIDNELLSYEKVSSEYSEKEKYKSTSDNYVDGQVLGTSGIFYGFDPKNTNYFDGKIEEDKDLYDITKNKWLRTKQKVLQKVLNKEVNRVYHNEITDYNSNKYRHVVTIELTDQAIGEMLLEDDTILSDIGDNHASIDSFKAAGMHILSNEYRPEYDFETISDKKQITDTELEDYAKISDQEFETRLKNRLLFSDDIYTEQLKNLNSYRTRILRKGIQEFANTGKDVVVSTSKVSNISNGEVRIKKYVAGNLNYNKVTDVASEEILSSQGITRGKEGFQLITTDKQTGLKKFILSIDRGVTPLKEVIATSGIIDNDYLAAIKQESDFTNDEEVKESLRILDEFKEKGYDDNTNRNNIEKAKQDVSLIFDSLGIIKFAEVNANFIQKSNYEVYNKFFYQVGTRHRLKGNLTDKRTTARAFLEKVIKDRNSYNISQGSVKETKYGWSQNLYKHVYDGSFNEKGNIIEENLVTRFEGLNQKGIYTTIDERFNKSSVNVLDDKSASNTSANSHLGKRSKMHKEMVFDVSKYKWIEQDNTREQIRAMIGDHVDNHLWINDTFITDGDKVLLGRVKDALIMLSSYNGKIEKYTPRHEAAHFILTYLVNKEQRGRILKEAETRLKKDSEYLQSKGIVGKPSFTDINEYIANLFEGKKYLASNQKNTLLNRFIDFMRRLLSRIKFIGNDLNNFMYSVDRGYYANRPVMNLESNAIYDKAIDNKYVKTEILNKLLNVFGNELNIQTVITNDLRPIWKEFSPVSLSATNFVPTLYDSILFTINDFAKDRKTIEDNKATTIVRERNSEGKLVTIYNGLISEMTSEHFTKTIIDTTSKYNRDAYLDYVIYHLGDPEISKALLQQLFKSMDVEKIYDNAINMLFQEVSINGKNFIKIDNELSNPTDGRSILLSTMMSTIRYRDYKTGQQFGRNVVYEQNLSPVFQNAFDKLREDSAEITYHNFLKVLYERLVDSRVEPNEKSIIFSFLAEYGNKQSIPITIGKNSAVRYITPKNVIERVNSDDKIITELEEAGPPVQFTLDNKGDFIKNAFVEVFGTAVEQIEDQKAVDMKLDQLQTMINAIYSYYSSNKTSYVTNDEYSRKGLKTTDFEGNNISISKNNMKERMTKALTNNGQISLKVYNAIIGDKRKFTVNDKGITYRNGTPVITRTVNRNGVDSYTSTPTELHFLANFLGMNEVTVDIINTIDVNQLAKTFYMMMMALKVSSGLEDSFKAIIANIGADQEISVEENDIINKFTSTAGNKTEYDIITKFYEVMKYKPENVSEREYKTTEQGTTISEMRLFLPMDMWKDIEFLSEKTSWDTFDTQNTSYRTVDGERAYNITLGSFYSGQWNLGSKNAIFKIDKELKESQEIVKSPLVKYNKGVKEYNNALLDNLFYFDHIKNYGGISGDFKSASWMRMSMQDAFMSMIERTWNSLKYSTGEVAMQTMSFAFADKSYMPIAPVYYKNKDSIIKVSKPKGGKISVRTQVHVLIPIIDKINSYYETQRAKALVDIKQTIGYSGSDNINDLNIILSKISKRSDIGKKIIKDLTLNYHYKHDKDNDVFTVGNAITSELSPFKEDFSSRWNSTSDMNEKYNILKETFNEQYIHFIQTIKESGYELPEEIKDLFINYKVTEGLSEESVLVGIKDIGNDAKQQIGEPGKIYGKLLKGETISQEEFDRLTSVPKEALTEEYIKVLNSITEGRVLTEAQLKTLYGGISKEKNRIKPIISKREKNLRTKMASDEYKQVDSKTGEINWHPLLEGIFWNFYIVNESMQQLDRGSMNMYSNVTDFVKRAAGLIAPKTLVNVHDPKGIGKTMRVLVTEDMAMEEEQNELYNAGYKWKIMSDGFSAMNPVSWHLLYRSAGAEAGIFTQGAIKPMVYDYNAITNQEVYFKFSQMPITFEFMSGKYYQDLMAMMLNIVVPETGRTIWDMYKGQLTKNFNSFDLAIKNIVKVIQKNPSLREQMVDFVVPESAYKSGMVGLNLYDRINESKSSTIDNIILTPEQNRNAINVDASKYGIQTYLLQDTDETEKALATQILAIMGLLDSNHEFVAKINEALAGFVDIAVRKLKSLTSEQEIRDFIKEITISGSVMQGESVKNLTIMNNTSFESDVLEDKYYRSIVGYLNKYVRPDMPGQSNTQMPSYLYMYEKNGKLYDAKDIFIKNEDGEDVRLPHDRIDVEGYNRRLLKPETYLYEDGDKFVEFKHIRNDKGEITTRARDHFNKVLADGKVKVIYRPAEVITSFNYMNKFGLVPTMTMTDCTVLNIGNRRINLYDARTNGYKMNFSDFYDILKHEFTDVDTQDIYSSLNENIAKEINRRIVENKGNFKLIKDQYHDKIIEELKVIDAETTYLKTGDDKQDNINKAQVLNAKYDAMVNEYVLKDHDILLNTIADYYNSFNQALDVYFMKIPTTNASSGGMGRIVAFSPTAKNVFFFSPEQNILSDGDFDADPIQVFFRSLNKEGKIIRKLKTIKEEDGTETRLYEKQYNQNMIFDALEDFYSNVANSIQVLAKIDLSTFRARVSSIKEDLYINNPGSFIKLANQNKQGKRVVGFFANQNTLTVKLRHIPYKVRLANNIFNKSLSIIFDNKQALQAIEFITKLVQGATDNANEGGMLGKLNINEVTSPLISGLTLLGIEQKRFNEEILNGNFSNQVENFVMDIIQNDPLVKKASDIVQKSFTVKPGKRKYIYDVFETMLKDFTNDSEKSILKDYGIETSKEKNILVKDENDNEVLKSANDFLIEKLEIYKKYSLIGEQLRRFSYIPTIQQEFHNNKPEIHKLRVDIEVSMGMSIEDFLANINTIKNNQKSDIDSSIEWLKNNHMKYSMTKEVEAKERIIRDGFSIAKVVANSPNLVAYVRALQAISEMSDKVFNTTKIEKPLYDSVLRIAGKDMLTYPDDWKSLYELKKDIVNAAFLEDKHSKFNIEVSSDVNPFGDKTTFNMGNIKDRTEFVMFVPDYIRTIKAKYGSNQFVQKLRFKPTRDGLEYIEFSNNLNMSPTEKTIMQDEFNKLDKIDPMATKILRMYQFITYGFRYKNGSYTEMTDTVMESEFSDWVKDFNADKVISKIDEIIRSAAPIYPDLIGTKDNIANGATIYKGYVNNEIDPTMYIYQGSGEFKEDSYKMLTNPAPRWMNSVVMDSSYSTLPVIRGIELDDLIKLRNGVPGGVKVRNYRYRIMPKVDYDKWIAKQIEKGKIGHNFALYSGSTAITVDGTYVKTFASTDKSDIMVFPINEFGDEIKASAISYNTRKTTADVLTIITDKISSMFPYIKVEYNNNDTSLYPSLLGYISNGIVYLNTDRMEPGTPFHEIVGHIFVDYLQQNNPNIYNQLKQQAENLINSNNPDVKRILDNPNYKNLSAENQIKEVIATIVGWTSEDVIDEHFKAYGVDLKPVQKSTLWNTIKDVIAKFYQWMKNAVGRLFGINMSDATLIERLSSSDLTIEGFARMVTEQILKQKGPITNYTTGQYGKLTGDQVRKMSALTKEQFRDTKIKSMDDFTNLLKNTTRIPFKQLSLNDKVLYLKTSINNNRGFLVRKFTGLDDIDFNVIDPKLWDDRLMEIAKNFTEQNNIIPDNIIKFHNEEGGNIHSSSKIFGNKKDNIRPKYSETSLSRLNAIVGYNPSMKVYKYSWLKNIPKYEHFYNESLVGEDALVYIQETDDGKTYLSLYNVSNESISATPDNKRENLMNFMYDQSGAQIKGVSGSNTIGNIKALSLALIGQYINSVADTNTYIEDAGVIQFTPSDSYYVSVDPVTSLNDLRILSEDKRFTSMLDNDVFKKIFDSKTLRPLHVNYESLLLSTWNNMEDKPYYMYEFFDKRADRTVEDLEKLFKTRLIELNKNRDFSTLSTDEIKEYKMLMKTSFVLGRTPIADTSLSSDKAINTFNKWFQTGLDYDNEVIKKLRETMLNSSNKIVDEFNNGFRKAWFDDTVKYFIKEYGEMGSQYLKENTSKYYEKLFVKTVVKDNNNNDVNMNTGYIYWTKDEKEDPMFAKDAKGISDEMLAHGRKIVNATTDMYTKLLLHRKHKNDIYSYTEDNGKTWKDYDYARARWELLNQTAYREGMLPAMDMTVGELFASGKWGTAWKKKWIQITDTYVMFDDYAGMNEEEKNNMDHLQDMFLHQIGIDQQSDNTIYGSKSRLSILGLIQDNDGKWIVNDIQKNNNMSMDIETILAYFTMSGLRTINYEQDVLPVFNAAKMYVLDLEHNKGMDQKNVSKLIDLIIEGPIKGKRTITTGDLAGLKIDPAISSFQSVFGTVALFGNINVGMVSALTNGMKGFIESVANSLIDRGLPTAKHLVQASGLVFSNYKKVTQLATMFQVCNMSEYELTSSRRHVKGKKTIVSEHIGHWFNWSTDMYARGVMMVAQMLYDGSWDAYTYNEATGKVDYDESKDKQWNDRKDEQKGDGKIRREDVKKMLIREGTMSAGDKKLTRGYDYKAARKFKALGDKYIVGAYDDKTKAMLGQTLTGRMAGMFHTYLTSMIQNAFQKRTPIDELGKRIVVLDREGNRVAEWERLYVEGYVTTIVTYLKSLYTYLRTGDKQYLKLDKLGQYNMYKVLTMLLLYLFITGLYKLGVDKKDDKDDDDNPIPEYRLIKNFKYAAYGLFTIPAALNLFDRPWAAASMAKRMFQNQYGQMKLDNMVNIIPVYKSTIEPITEVIKNDDINN